MNNKQEYFHKRLCWVYVITIVIILVGFISNGISEVYRHDRDSIGIPIFTYFIVSTIGYLYYKRSFEMIFNIVCLNTSLISFCYVFLFSILPIGFSVMNIIAGLSERNHVFIAYLGMLWAGLWIYYLKILYKYRFE